MHIQIITFQLKDLSEDDYINLCNQVAPSFAAVPGLISMESMGSSGSRSA